MEVLLRVVDKGVAIECSKAGDVIAICPDGWPWSQEELTRDEWRIVRCPLTQTMADAILSTFQNQATGKFVRRQNTLNLTLLPNPSQYVGVRTVPIITITRQQALAAVVQKTRPT